MDLNELKKIVKDAIDDGATNLEQIHKSVANLPFDYLDKLKPLWDEKTKDLKDFQDKTIGNVYDFMRKLNNAIDEIGSDLLGFVSKDKKK